MQSDDQFRRAFQTETARLTRWVEALRGDAVVECESDADFWRVRLTPEASNACPVEVLLHRSSQTCDFQIGPESWENQPIKDLEHFLPLLDAIAGGRVTHRNYHTAAAGLLWGVDVVIALTDGTGVTFSQRSSRADQLKTTAAITRERHWVAYRRKDQSKPLST